MGAEPPLGFDLLCVGKFHAADLHPSYGAAGLLHEHVLEFRHEPEGGLKMRPITPDYLRVKCPKEAWDQFEVGKVYRVVP